MDVEAVRAYLLTLPHVVETMQWGDNLVFWVGDKAIGGKMFALIDLAGGRGLAISFAAGLEGAAELCEMEGCVPAPYLARAHWIAVERWDVFSTREWQTRLAGAHRIVYDKLPPKAKKILELPVKQRTAAIAERRRRLREAARK